MNNTTLARAHAGRQLFRLHPLVATLAAASILSLPCPPVHAGSIAATARASLARRAAAQSAAPAAAPTAFGKRAFGKPHDVIIERTRHPQAAAHIERAQRTGQPTVLHVDRKGAAARRAEAIGTVNRKHKPAPGWERDEYPPAFVREGGVNASVSFIHPHDNRGAGSTMRHQTRNLPDGSKIRVLVR